MEKGVRVKKGDSDLWKNSENRGRSQLVNCWEMVNFLEIPSSLLHQPPRFFHINILYLTSEVLCKQFDRYQPTRLVKGVNSLLRRLGGFLKKERDE